MTMTISEIIEKRSDIVETLNEAGISASCYAKPPMGAATFILGKGVGIPGQILLWPGDDNTEIEVVTDKERRQAVVHVDEKPRAIVRTVVYAPYHPQDKATVVGGLKSRFGIQMPPGTTFKVGTVVEKKEPLYSGRTTYEAKVTAKTKRTRQSFLVGIDESSYFICPLPRRAENVEEAHKVLRPKGVKADALRQGEFFLIPVPKAEQAKIDKLHSPDKGPRWGGTRWNGKAWALENNSSHVATESKQTGTVKGKDRVVYVRGTVQDTRRGHHTPIKLDTWHRVVRNTELVNTTMARPTRRWD